MTHVPVTVLPDTIGYIRVSTEDQASERKTSLAQQRQAIVELAGRIGRSVGPVYEDAGVSGGTADRPAFQAMLQYCRQHPRKRSNPGYVLVLNDSRWGRFPDPEQGTALRWQLKDDSGWIVRFVEGDSDDKTRPILRALHAMQATAYRDALRANTRRGARGAAGKGLWMGEAPLGYRRAAARPGQPPRVLEIGQRKATDEESRLVLGPAEEVALVRSIFERYASGTVTLNSLARDLRPRSMAARWSSPRLRSMLVNPVYIGDLVWCRTTHSDEGEFIRRHPEEWVTVHQAHPAIVSVAVFERVQQILARNKVQTRAAAGRYPLSGLIHCAQCGQAYVGGGGPQRDRANPDRYRFYRDSGAHKDSGAGRICQGPTGTMRKTLVEKRVIQAVARHVSSPGVQQAVERALDAQLSQSGDSQQDDLAKAQQERRRFEGERERLISAVASGVVEESEARNTLARLRTDIERATAQVERLRFAGRKQLSLASERDRLLAIARDFEGILARASASQVRELLRPWLASAIMDKVNRKLTLELRRVPATAFVLNSETSARRCKQEQNTVRRTISLPPGRGRARHPMGTNEARHGVA